MNNIKKWWISATPNEIKSLAKLAETSVEYLRQLANGQRNGKADLAAKLEIAAAIIRHRNRAAEARLPILRCGDIAVACASCRYFNQATQVVASMATPLNIDLHNPLLNPEHIAENHHEPI